VLRELNGESIIVTTDASGAVRAFYNVCRHRGTKLCTEAEGRFAGSIQCPYHSWTYDLSGRLVGAPHMEEVPHFRREDYPLHAVHAGEWDGHVFVNLIKANWKLLIQNYNECLHCPNLHPALNKLSHYLSGENEPLQPTYMGGRMDLRPGVETLSMDGTCPRAFLPGLSSEDVRRVYYYAIFPNMFLSLHPDYMLVHTLWPIAPDRSINVCEWHFHRDEVARPDFFQQDAIDFWDMTNRQDWRVCELSQAGIASRAYTPGPYSNREDLLYAFDRMIVAFHACFESRIPHP
jgi:Rieske 2Fe-2S family protein